MCSTSPKPRSPATSSKAACASSRAPAGSLADDLQRMYLASGAGARPLEVAIGFYELWNSILYNSALWVRLGGTAPLIRHVHRKNFLPTYGLFDEERFVERGHDIRAFDTPWGKFAMLVCEDAWHSLPGTLLALDGATMIFISSAAPARGVYPRDDAIPGPASVARWERLVRDIAEEQGVFVSFANLVANEGGKSFPGRSDDRRPRRRSSRAWAALARGARRPADRSQRPRARARRDAVARRSRDADAAPHRQSRAHPRGDAGRAGVRSCAGGEKADEKVRSESRRARAPRIEAAADIEIMRADPRVSGAPSSLSHQRRARRVVAPHLHSR